MSNNANLYATLAAGFPAEGSSVALETPSAQYSWSDIDHISGRFANLLCALGLSDGARIAVQVEKSPEALMLYLATIRAGLVYLPLNIAYKSSEVEYFLRDAEPSVLVCSSKNLEWARKLADQTGTEHVYTLDEDGSGTLSAAAAGQPAAFETAHNLADDLAVIIYTSGTTGRSKGSMLSHRNLVSNAQVLNDCWGWTRNDVLLHMLPIFHVHGLFVASHGALLAGAKMIWLPKFDVDQALLYLPRSTVMMGVPTYYVRLLADPRLTADTCRAMRLFVSGSAPLLIDTFKAFQAHTGHTVLERYGMSETVMLTSNPYQPEHGERIGGTVGRALPGVLLRVADSDGNSLGAGETGAVEVCGPNVFSGYWRMPEKTREEFTADGWFRTGDIGSWGAGAGTGVPEDYLSIVGRSKDLIISGGFNVYPKEIELLIDEMPGVAESAVIGVPHHDFGEVVVAVVVAKEGATLDADTLARSLKPCLANFKMPKRIHLVDQLPRNAMGKVQKKILRETYEA